MTPLAEMYRDELVRAVVPDRPAMVFQVNHPTVLADYCELLADACKAKELLRANGHGKPGMSVLELVQLLLAAPPAPVAPAKRAPARKRKGKS